MSTLDADLLAAHAAGDAPALVQIYQRAAAETQYPDEAAFFLTHAMVFALDCGHADTDALRAQLVAMGREQPLEPVRPPRR